MTHIHQVPFFPDPYCFDSDSEAFEKVFRMVAGRGTFIMQKELSDFEARLATYLACGHAIGVGNATDGLCGRSDAPSARRSAFCHYCAS